MAKTVTLQEAYSNLANAIIEKAIEDYVEFAFKFSTQPTKTTYEDMLKFYDAKNFLENEDALANLTNIEGGGAISKSQRAV